MFLFQNPSPEGRGRGGVGYLGITANISGLYQLPLNATHLHPAPSGFEMLPLLWIIAECRAYECSNPTPAPPLGGGVRYKVHR